jgi:hypothetical protein
MKQIFITGFLILVAAIASSQEVLRLKNGSSVTIQNGVELTVQGGITLENGSLFINNGTTRLLNNSIANQSDWRDNSFVGALGGNGLVIFNSNLLHQYWGPTHFYNVQINTGGLTVNNSFTIDNQLNLIKGKINTASNYVFLANNSAASLVNDGANTGYSNSWINGNFRRQITTNTSTYDFPVGSNRPNLLQFLNNNISGPTYLTASFGTKPGTDAGLNVSESGVAYTAINNGGVWYLIPDAASTSGNYALQLYLNGFTGLADNLFGILRRPDASTSASDWMVPSGSSLEPVNGLGRKLSDGFARRKNITSFSQWGIGMTGSLPCVDCPSACTYTQGFYGNVNGIACYNNSGTSISSYQLMLNAFGATTSQVFGSVANRRFFTLYKTDITSKNIYKMLPGSGNSQPIAVDNILPYDGAYYGDASTWSLVPIQPSGSQKGKINNLLLSQTISLWFNLHTSSSLAAIDLSMDTLVTVAQTSCGSGILVGTPVKFGLPHNVIVYLNGGNGYANNVNGLFQLTNDVLGGVNTSISAADIQSAVATINNAFDGCRVLTGAIPYTQSILLTQVDKKNLSEPIVEKLTATAFPNPFDKQFSLAVVSPVSGMATIEFFDANGAKISEQVKYLKRNATTIVLYKEQAAHRSSILYRIGIGDYKASGIVIGPN